MYWNFPPEITDYFRKSSLSNKIDSKSSGAAENFSELYQTLKRSRPDKSGQLRLDPFLISFKRNRRSRRKVINFPSHLRYFLTYNICCQSNKIIKKFEITF
jgi:hypothetical protein